MNELNEVNKICMGINNFYDDTRNLVAIGNMFTTRSIGFNS